MARYRLDSLVPRPTPPAGPTASRPPRPIEPWQLRRLWGLWKKLSPSLEGEADERTLRLDYTSRQLGRPVASWSELKRAEAGRLIAALKRDLGEGAVEPRLGPAGGGIITALALELWGGYWDALLGDRLRTRFRKARIEELAPRQAQALIEELLSRVARRDLLGAGHETLQPNLVKAKSEELRARFAREQERQK